MGKIEKLKQFLNDNPEDSFLKHALALEYVKAGNDGEAEKLFTEILENRQDYLGSYYHLGKLLERKNEEQQAIAVYEKGMQVAKAAGDNHAYSELKSACDYLLF